MRFSFWPNTGQDWSELLDVSQYAERTGWDGIWVADHFMPMAGDLDVPMHECWSVLRRWRRRCRGSASARWWRASPTATRRC